MSAGPANESSQTLTFTVTNDNNGLFSVQPGVAANGTLTYTPAANANGVANVTVQLKDNGGTANTGVDTNSQTFTITVNAVNDIPSFTKGANQTVLEDAGAQSVAGWATALSAGPANESSQTLSFVVDTNSNSALFAVQPQVAADGTLTYTPAANANGAATITLHVQDSGGTANGGVNSSATQSFTITVTAVNDAPSFTKGSNLTVAKGAAAQTVTNWATAISAGPNESGQTLTFSVSTSSLLQTQATINSSTGTLTYRPGGTAGVATLTVTLSDNGGTANGGSNTTPAPQQTFTITIQ
jgi:VCBS repeat-containing protein